MTEKDQWPEQYPKADKKENLPRKWPIALQILVVGVMIGILLGIIASRLFRGSGQDYQLVNTEETATAVFAQTVTPRATQVAEWTPETPDSGGRVIPTMTPWRVMGEDETRFSVHLYTENFVGETGAQPRVSFTELYDEPTLYVENGVSIAYIEALPLLIGEETAEIDGRELALRHDVNLSITISQPVTALGVTVLDGLSGFMVDGTDSCTSPAADYQITFTAGDEVLGSVPLRLGSGPYFYGVTASRPFDGVQISAAQTAAVEQANCIADFLGPIWTN